MVIAAETLRTQYFELLEKECNEQVYQKYLEENTRLIPREFVQNHGISCSLVLRKLSFGSDYKSDFFYFSKSSIDWNAVFIELEKPSSKFFRKGTNEFHSDFNHAVQQINNWRAWFNRGNQTAFLDSVKTIQVPHHMAAFNPTYNKYVLVFGRRAEYGENEIRRSMVKGMERDDFKIITYDSLAEDLEHKYQLSIGVRRNEFIDILTDEITNSGMYAWVEPTKLRVSERLFDRLKNGPKSNIRLVPERLEAHQYAADKVRVRKGGGDTEPQGDAIVSSDE